MNICKECGKEFDKSIGTNSINFCSRHCRAVYTGKQCKHRNLNSFKQYNISNRAPFGTWKCKHCDFIGHTRRELSTHCKEVHPENYNNHHHQPWNKGLTKETSQSILKGIISLKKRYESGELQGVFKGKHHSLTTKEKLSKIRSNQLNSTAGFQDIKWYTVKNITGKEFILRGLWEVNVANKLNELNILWERGKSISYIKEGQTRTYNPDFYLPATNEYVEVKGYYSETDKTKMRLVSEQHPELKILFIDQWHYADFIAGKLSISQNDLQLWY